MYYGSYSRGTLTIEDIECYETIGGVFYQADGPDDFIAIECEKIFDTKAELYETTAEGIAYDVKVTCPQCECSTFITVRYGD